MTDENAKAVQEIAKTTRKGMELAEKAGPFIERVVGPPIENAVGIVSDRLAYYRLKQFFSLVKKTKKILSENNITNTRTVAPPIALPLIEAASLETNETLHDLWASLLAKAMDPGSPPIKRSFVGILKEFEPVDVLLLRYVYQITLDPTLPHKALKIGRGLYSLRLDELAEQLEITTEECEMSLLNVDRLGCIIVGISPSVSDEEFARIETATVNLTYLGKALVEASMK